MLLLIINRDNENLTKYWSETKKRVHILYIFILILHYAQINNIYIDNSDK